MANASSSLSEAIKHISAGQTLSSAQSEAAFQVILSGEAHAAQIGALLMGLRLRGETVHEITGAVRMMREKMLPVDAPDGAVDIVGTGGDLSGSYNVSTCAAFIVAGCDVPVAKHGNRSITSKSGAADVLEALGVYLSNAPQNISRDIQSAGIGFMFAVNHHPAMAHVGPVRALLGIRTIFNLIGPLSNPAGVSRQLVGVFAKEWVLPFAQVLQEVGSQEALVVHGLDGLDEITTSGPTAYARLSQGRIESGEITPEQFGLKRVAKSAYAGGDPAHNAKALRAVLEGAHNAYRDIAIINAAGGLTVAGRCQDIGEGVALASRSIDSGAALARLDALIQSSNELTQ